MAAFPSSKRTQYVDKNWPPFNKWIIKPSPIHSTKFNVVISNVTISTATRLNPVCFYIFYNKNNKPCLNSKPLNIQHGWEGGSWWAILPLPLYLYLGRIVTCFQTCNEEWHKNNENTMPNNIIYSLSLSLSFSLISLSLSLSLSLFSLSLSLSPNLSSISLSLSRSLSLTSLTSLSLNPSIISLSP